MTQDKEMQNMRNFDQMDWMTYGNSMKAEGEKNKSKETAKNLIK